MVKDIILKAYHFRGRKKGARQIQMTLQNHYHITLDIVINTLKQLTKQRHLASDALIHSNQVFHYTHPTYQALVKKMGFRQSMSRRGNCWDNAPQESFFGHLKDDTTIKTCATLEEVKREIKSYLTYCNHYRGQWNLKKLPPVKYRQQLQAMA
ncbi:IS3 family transposase [Kurthia gibsonii]